MPENFKRKNIIKGLYYEKDFVFNKVYVNTARY